MQIRQKRHRPAASTDTRPRSTNRHGTATLGIQKSHADKNNVFTAAYYLLLQHNRNRGRCAGCGETGAPRLQRLQRTPLPLFSYLDFGDERASEPNLTLSNTNIVTRCCVVPGTPFAGCCAVLCGAVRCCAVHRVYKLPLVVPPPPFFSPNSTCFFRPSGKVNPPSRTPPGDHPSLRLPPPTYPHLACCREQVRKGKSAHFKVVRYTVTGASV